ncbi:MAG: epimerase [Acidobacteria bacterium SCN 69-37]|nr:MAG: epimerase [Acidobacteria bacterium SCN 69-37]
MITFVPHSIFVSGATGFIATHTIAQLLAAGHRVRGSVRSTRNAEVLAPLRVLPGADDRLDLVEADLLAPDAFAGHLEGCDVVLHMASPYALDVKDPQRDLVDPAVTGTTSLLTACLNTPGIRRVVLTSSMAAVTDEPDGRMLTEADWNTHSALTRNPYYLSKVRAERAAWAFIDTHRPSWDLIAINPFLVIGPSLTRALNTSNKVVADLLNGAYPAILALTWGVVDVRDVADAHVRAMDAPGAAGRYLCLAGTMTAREMVALLRSRGYDGYRLPRLGLDGPVGTALVRLAAYAQAPGIRQYLRTNLGRSLKADNTKIRRDLDIAFRPIEQTVLDAAADLVTWGHVRRNG